MVGIISFPYPCKAPFIVWSNIVKIIVNELICNTTSPELALVNNKFKIGPANKHIPIVHGRPINIDVNNENDRKIVIEVYYDDLINNRYVQKINANFKTIKDNMKSTRLDITDLVVEQEKLEEMVER